MIAEASLENTVLYQHVMFWVAIVQSLDDRVDRFVNPNSPLVRSVADRSELTDNYAMHYKHAHNGFIASAAASSFSLVIATLRTHSERFRIQYSTD